MKRPRPDLGAAMSSAFVTSMGGVRKLRRLWGTTTVNGTEVLTRRQYYHPTSKRQGYDGSTSVPKEYEKIMRFLGAYEDATNGSKKGLKSAWMYFNKNNLKSDLVNAPQFVTDNLNLVFWDPAEGIQPEGITLTTSFVIEHKQGTKPVLVKGPGNNRLYEVPTTELLNKDMTEAQMIQVIQDNYETLWNTCLIKQEGTGIVNRGSYVDPTTNSTVQDIQELSPDDPWLDTVTRYALRNDGIPCTIKSVERGVRSAFYQPIEWLPADPIMYTSYVVTVEIPARVFSPSELFVQSIASDLTFVYGKNGKTKNGYYTKKSLMAMDSTDLEDDELLINRPYILWEDSTFSSDPRFDSIWMKYDGRWYLKADAFTNPGAYGLKFKELGAYVFALIDTDYKKKKVPWYKKVAAFVLVVIVIAISVVFPPAGATLGTWAVAVASAVLVASLVLVALALLSTALGSESWAAAFAELNKDIEPLVQVAMVVLIVAGISKAVQVAREAGAKTLQEAVGRVVVDQITNMVQGTVDAIIQGATDIMAGNLATNAAIGFMNVSLQIASMPMQNRIKSLQERNKDLQAEYQELMQESARETDVLQGFAQVYSKPATADWSMYAATFDMPYERGGGPMALGNIQRTTVQALRKGTYKDPAFANILVV